MEELKEIETPISDFILAQKDLGTDTNNGRYFHYSEVCQMLNRMLIAKESNVIIKFYAVRSQDGKFFRSRGYNPYSGNSKYNRCWVDDIEKAKIYQRPGLAKAQQTWWFKHYPKYGKPDVVELIVTDTKIHVVEPKKSKSKLKKALTNPSTVFSNQNLAK